MRICIVLAIARPCVDTQSFQSSQKALKVQSHELLRRVDHLVPDVDVLRVLSPVGRVEREFVLITRQIKHFIKKLIDLISQLGDLPVAQCLCRISFCHRLYHLQIRSEEHTSELQSLMRISYAVFCLKKKLYKNYKTKDKYSKQ